MKSRNDREMSNIIPKKVTRTRTSCLLHSTQELQHDKENYVSLTFPSAVDTTVTCVVNSSSSINEGSVMMVPSNTPQVKGIGTCRITNVVGASGAEGAHMQKPSPKRVR